MRIRPEKLIVTSNYLPEQCFSNRENIPPILRRFRVVQDLSDLPPIPEEVPAVMMEPWGNQEVNGEVQEVQEVHQEVQEAEEVHQDVQEAGAVILEGQEVKEGQLEPPQSLVLEVIEQIEEKAGGEEEVKVQEDELAGQQDYRCNQQ